MRRIGILTTDEHLVVASWDDELASMVGISGREAIGRPLASVVPDLDARGLLAIARDTLETGGAKVLAAALHHYLIPCPPSVPSARFDRMQQRIALGVLQEERRTVGLMITVEDVTERLDLEHELSAELRRPDPAARRRAVERLALVNPVEGLGPLPSALGDDDWQVRRLAVETLAGRRDPALVDALVSALRERHRNFSVLSSALQLLTVTGVDLTLALVDLVRHTDTDLRIQAALALGMHKGADAVQALLGALDDDDVNVRFHAIESLGKLGAPAAVERLAAIAESGDFFLAFPALEALARINDAAVAPRLIPLLGDDRVGDQAAEALGQIGDEDAVAPLCAALDRPQMSPSSIVEALMGIHERYDKLFSGGGVHIEELTRRAISPSGATRVVDAAGAMNGPSLRHFATLLGWLRGAEVQRALAHMLGTPGVHGALIEAIVRFGAPMVDGLLEQLHHDDTGIRRDAVEALGRIGDSRAVLPLIGLLYDEDRDLRMQVISALARLGDGRAFEPLIGLLADDELAVRHASIGALNSIGHRDMSARMLGLLDDPDPRLRESAVRIAGYFGYPSCADALVARCHDRDETVRAAALEHLAYLEDPRSAPLLADTVLHDTPRARSAAAQALAYVESAEAVHALRRSVDDPDPWVRYFSVTSLGRQGDRASLLTFERLARGDDAHQVRIAAIEAMGAVAGAGDEEAVRALGSLAADANDELAVAAAQALGAIDTPSALEPLRAALSSDQQARRLAAIDSLARRGHDPEVELLRWTAAADGDPAVIQAAIDALRRLGATGRSEAAIQALIDLAGDPARRAAAIGALARLPVPAIPLVGKGLSSRNAFVRQAVVEALGRLEHPTASSYVSAALADSEPAVRQQAVAVLSRLGTRGVARSLAEIARTDPSDAVRRAAGLALQRVRRTADEDAERPAP